MVKKWNQWAPVPLRLVLGVGIIQAGFPKLFIAAGRANIAHLLAELGVPAPQVMGWVVGAIEVGGGLGILAGAFIQIVTSVNIISFTILLIMSWFRGGIPEPLPGGAPFPDYPLAFVILAGMLTLLIGGAGVYSIDQVRSTARIDTTL